MNDRASNAPPPDFLGFDAEATAEYERQFALDWQPPDLGLRHHGTRNSFMSVNSAVSSATTTRKQNGPSFLAPLWGGVKERLRAKLRPRTFELMDRSLFPFVASLLWLNPILIIQGIQHWAPSNLSYKTPGMILYVLSSLPLVLFSEMD